MRGWLIPALVGALTLLVSLYLPWQEVSALSGTTPAFSGGPGGVPTAGLQNLFAGSADLNVEGWSLAVGGPAALSALLLTSLLVAGLARPPLLSRVPIGLCGLLVGYFAVAVAVDARSHARYQALVYREVGALRFHFAYGAYLGIAGGIVSLVAAGGLRRNEFVRYRSVLSLAAVALAAGVLISLLLPWERVAGLQGTTFVGIERPAAVLAAVAVCAAAVWATTRPSAGRLALSAAAVLLIGAAVSGVTVGVVHAYGAWVGLGIGLAFAAVVIVDGTSALPRQRRLGWHTTAALVVVAIFLTALFLPWQKACYPTRSDLGRYSGRCLTTNGWVTLSGSTAAILILLVAVAVRAPRRSRLSLVELALATALFVATLGFELVPTGGVGLHIGRGAIVGFAAAAALLVITAPLQRPTLEWHRLAVFLAPIAACFGYLAILVVPWWGVLPPQLQSQSLTRFAPLSWLTVASALLGIHLLGCWMERAGDGSARPHPLVLVPLALLTLAALDLIRLHSDGITWGGGIIVALCILLALLARIETRSGLENMHLPEILRVDRL